MNEVTIYTDGSARGNPGPGGFGIVMLAGNYAKEFSEGYRYTTNNRMELLGVITALEKLRKPGTLVLVVSDSKYVVDAVEKGWVFGWEQKRFAKAKNPDLWKRFLIIFRQHQVKFKWIKGHAQNPYNNRCDELAVEAAKGHRLHIDKGYESTVSAKEGLF